MGINRIVVDRVGAPLRRDLVCQDGDARGDEAPGPKLAYHHPFKTGGGHLAVLVNGDVLVRSLPLTFVTKRELKSIFEYFFAHRLPVGSPNGTNDNLFVKVRVVNGTLFRAYRQDVRVSCFRSVFDDRLVSGERRAICGHAIVGPPLCDVNKGEMARMSFEF